MINGNIRIVSDTVNFLGNTITNDQIIVESENTQESWVFILILICFTILAFARFYHRTRFEMIIQASLLYRYTSQLIREGNVLRERISLYLSIIYLFSFTFFIYFGLSIITDIDTYFSSLYLYSCILLLVFLIWSFKSLAIRIVGNIFNSKLQASEHILSNFLINMTTGVILLILWLPLIYAGTNFFFYFGLLVLAFVFTLKLLNEFQIGMSHSKFSIFHLFLYLCTFEILPILLLVKFSYELLKNV